MEAQYGTDDDEKWFMGIIFDVHSDDTVDVLYEDNDFEKRKPLRWRPKSRAPELLHRPHRRPKLVWRVSSQKWMPSPALFRRLLR